MIAGTLSLIFSGLHPQIQLAYALYLFWLRLCSPHIPKTQWSVIFPLFTLRQLGTQTPPESSSKD